MITVKTREDFLLEVKKLLPEKLYAIELGCYQGEFSEKIIDILKPEVLYLVDPFKRGGKQYGKELNYLHSAYSDYRDYYILKERVLGWENTKVQIFKDFSFNVFEEFDDDAVLNFIYHDASHLYEDIKLDLEMWEDRIDLDNGLVCGHDYIGHPDFGVIRAVDEFCSEHNFEMIILNTNGGDYALKRI